MRILILALAALIALSSGVAARERILFWNLNVIYARGAGIKSSADEQEMSMKRRDRIGTGLLIYGNTRPVPPVPHRPRRSR
ncbi:MAG: hypothetical protein ACJ8AS_11255 [Hyphomicrobiales bacterium]